jgi:hypothetical protein
MAVADFGVIEAAAGPAKGRRILAISPSMAWKEALILLD